MSGNWRVGLPFTLLLMIVCGGVGLAGTVPLAVSPGDAAGTRIEGRCPTFSWGAVSGARSYEVVVYRIGEEGPEAEPVLRESFPGSVSSWTPPLDACLERGGRYAWSLRARGPDGMSDWSSPSLFEVASAPSEAEFEQALEVVRRFLGIEEGGAGVPAGAPSPKAAPRSSLAASSPLASGGPAPLASVAGDPLLQVNGAPVVTTATFGAGLCGALTYRFVDQGDGTVRDCKTGRIWLKDADCLGTGTWGSSGTNGTVQKKVADLNGGAQFNCAGYTPGTYTDWQVPAMTALCGAWDGSCSATSCCTAGAGLVDTAYTSPALANAAEDGKWAAEDAFVNVQSASTGYWSSAAGGVPNTAWGILLSNGLVGIGSTSTSAYVWPVRAAP